MGRRRRNDDLQLFQDLLVFVIYMFGSVVGCIIRAVNGISEQKRKANLLNGAYIDFSRIDAMSGVEFEDFISELLKRNGFHEVRTTKATGDYGVDVIAKKNGKTWVFQCKCFAKNVGLKPIQEVCAGARKYGADYAVAVTNRYFTPNAHELARDADVMLWDRDTLKFLINN